jgi:hypothetical protein
MQRLAKLVLPFAICVAALSSTASAGATTVHRCGNPPNWSGSLTGYNVGCHKARAVFNGLHCTDQACSDIRSGKWECFRRTVRRYEGRGTCFLGRKRIRWEVHK